MVRTSGRALAHSPGPGMCTALPGYRDVRAGGKCAHMGRPKSCACAELMCGIRELAKIAVTTCASASALELTESGRTIRTGPSTPSVACAHIVRTCAHVRRTVASENPGHVPAAFCTSHRDCRTFGSTTRTSPATTRPSRANV
eukprot:1972467-Rhodomonas_salina.1